MWQEALVEIGCVTGGTADPAVAADESLAILKRIVPYAAACISRYDPLTGRHATLADAGYPSRVRDHLDNWFVAHDHGYRHMRAADPTPLRWRDLREFHYRDSYSAQEVFLPAGFVEGVTVCLYTRDRRYTGSLHLSVDDPSLPTDESMPALRALQTMLSGLADGLRAVADPLAVLGPDDNTAVVGRDGRAVPIPGRPAGGYLGSGGALAELVAAVLDEGRMPPSFWWRDAAGAWHRVRLYPIASGAAVVEAEAPIPYELTARELDVLTLMAAGHTNPGIATVLVVTPKTAAKHVEHVLAKLGCASRTEAAVRAIREGLIRLPVPSRAGQTLAVA